MPEETKNMERVSQRRRQRQKKKKIKIISCVVIFAVLIYLAAAVFVSFRGNVSTVTALNGSVTEGFRTTGYIFRTQTCIEAPVGGYIECVVGEGERVRKDQVVAYVYSEKPSAELMGRLRDLYGLIRKKGIEGSMQEYGQASSVPTDISDAIRNMSDLRKNKNLAAVAEKKEKINLVLGGAGESDTVSSEAYKRLKADIDLINIQAGNGTEILAPLGGVFSSKIDGMEGKLDYANVDTLKPSDIQELDGYAAKQSDMAEAGQPLCKIINNYTWCFAALTDEKNLANVSIGQEVRLQFFDLTNNEISAKVRSKSEVENGKSLVVFSTNKYVDGIYSSSRINADVATVSAEGIKLPVSCLHVKDQITGVYVVRLDIVKFSPVNVKYKNDEWAIVSAAEPTDGNGVKLRIYDEVVVSGRNIEDGKRIR